MAAPRVTKAVWVVMVAASICAGAAVAGSGHPQIELRSSHLAAGDDVEIRGVRFSAGSKVRLSLRHGERRLPLGVATVDERGNFLESVYLPITLVPGSYEVLAAAGPHVVLRAPLALTSALPGSAPLETTTAPQPVVTIPRSVHLDDLRLKHRGTSRLWTVVAIAVAACSILGAVGLAVSRRPSSAPS